jgi:hypothetical protein
MSKTGRIDRMTEKRNHPPQSLPVANYKSAIARAVEWLGDRYLLASGDPLLRKAAHERKSGAR